MIGTKLAHYEITSHLGSGGMGDVYQATDAKLGRSVAIKLLPEAFTHDADRAARFEREARVLASLNHSNIAAIYGIEQSGERKFLVMELVGGETLAERIKRGPIPIDEALPIAKQIAGALEAAHEKGIVHRDLKPANIKITPQGQVKVLDFGLAKAFAGEGAEMNLSNSPTLSMAATNAGVILGTAAYMSPEQAKGKVTDRTTDIWAFGCVLYEMLTGRAPFEGETLGEILGSVFKTEPDWNRLPAETPPAIRRLLGRCLQKDRNLRLQHAGDARLDILEPRGEVETAVPSAKGRERLAWIVAIVALVSLAGMALVHLREVPAPEERLLKFSVPPPENSTLSFLEISPDGRRILVVSSRDGKRQMYLRSLDSPEFQPLSGTESARTPFWSPDSRFIGFFADGSLKVIPAAGGPVQELCSEAGFGGGGTWNREGVILFAGAGPLLRVNAAGGSCAVVGRADPKKSTAFPVFMPDGNHFFYVGATQGDDSSRGVYLAALDDPTPREILADYSGVVYSPPVAGGHAHLLFLRETTLMAQAFDEARLETVDDPFPVASQATTTLAGIQVAASVGNGILVYSANPSTVSQLTWVDRSGTELGKVGPPANQRGVALSGDGNGVLTSRLETNGRRAPWLYDLARVSGSRFIPQEMQPGMPVWFPDDRRVLLGMIGQAGPGLYQKDAKGGGQPELVLPISTSAQSASPSQAVGISVVPSAFSSDGRFLVYTVRDPKTQSDIWYLPWDGKPDLGQAMKFLGTDADESQPQLSPNGKWIAYWSDEAKSSGDVYIRPFPTGSGLWKVSINEGSEPRWSADSKHLYYIRALNVEEGILLAATVESDPGGGLSIGTPQELFEIHRYAIHPRNNVFGYSPHPDGRFLVNVLAETDDVTINVMTNWQKAVADRRSGQ